MYRNLFILGLLLCTTLILRAHTVGVQTDKATGSLKPGEYYWQPDLSPTGPVVLLVSLPKQEMVGLP